MTEKALLAVNDWDEHQTYRKDRPPPPWIKVHRRIFMSRKWAALTDAEKGQLISIWILAADSDGTVPADPAVLRKMAMLDDLPNINKYIELRLLTPPGRQHDANMTPDGCQSDVPEAEAEAKAEAKAKAEVVPDLILKNGETFQITPEFIDELKTAYPKVDVEQEIIKIVLWNRKYKDRRKTKAGAPKHISTWINKADKDRLEREAKYGGKQNTSPTRIFEGADYGESGDL